MKMETLGRDNVMTEGTVEEFESAANSGQMICLYGLSKALEEENWQPPTEGDEAFADLPVADEAEEEEADLEISYRQPIYADLSGERLEKAVNTDIEIIQRRMAEFNKHSPEFPRTGDFIRRLDGKLERFVHCWPREWEGSKAQTYADGSFYLGSNYLSHSGSCDPGLTYDRIAPTDETMMGGVWIFSQDRSGAGRGAHAMVRLRVFKEVAI